MTPYLRSLLRSLDPASVADLRVKGPVERCPRPHPRRPHHPAVVAQVRAMVETTPLTLNEIGRRADINQATISRWIRRRGWTRPPDAPPRMERSHLRYVPNVEGRALAARLRAQAERLVWAMEGSPTPHPDALAEALRLLAEAREAQKVRRGRKLVPPPRPPTPERPPRRAHDHAAAARLGWHRRYARAEAHQAWMRQKIEG